MVGRVAAIINNSANEKWQIKAVRFGWIDFVDDIEVSKALLKAVEDYGRSKGMTEIVGPLGFTDMDPEGMNSMNVLKSRRDSTFLISIADMLFSSFLLIYRSGMLGAFRSRITFFYKVL